MASGNRAAEPASGKFRPSKQVFQPEAGNRILGKSGAKRRSGKIRFWVCRHIIAVNSGHSERRRHRAMLAATPSRSYDFDWKLGDMNLLGFASDSPSRQLRSRLPAHQNGMIEINR
jgi:hypothetical protein